MSSSSARVLINQIKKLQKEPVDGFHCELIDESNVYEWVVYIKGTPDTPYEGAIYQAKLSFPEDYPFSPPKLQFTSDFWHPNIYDDGRVCISILHPPGEDEMSGESAAERWNPTQTPETILLSVISLLSDPNFSSPANVDASVMWRKDRKRFEEKCKQLAEKANKELPAGFVMPEPFKYKPEPQTPQYDDEEFEFEIDEEEVEEDLDDLDENVNLDDEDLVDDDLEEEN
ncbi:hypothetical protein ABK040_001443 [Willaertia magna]